MDYLIFSKESDELIDIFSFNEKELEKYLTKNPSFYAEEAHEEDIEMEEEDDSDIDDFYEEE